MYICVLYALEWMHFPFNWFKKKKTKNVNQYTVLCHDHYDNDDDDDVWYDALNLICAMFTQKEEHKEKLCYYAQKHTQI